MVWVVRYFDADGSGSFHPAHDTILQSTYFPTEERMGCSAVKSVF